MRPAAPPRTPTSAPPCTDSLGYDGIDVDWEPINAEDRAPLLALLQELRAARPGMLLTIPVGWVNTNFAGTVDSWYAQVAQVEETR
ncbi:MAG TPA: hypothetical protein VFY16_05280 [Gemmatimonadaceae bacterium]|nr:hypothetical protein [Gemmatimonadaceae bacterium]